MSVLKTPMSVRMEAHHVVAPPSSARPINHAQKARAQRPMRAWVLTSLQQLFGPCMDNQDTLAQLEDIRRRELMLEQEVCTASHTPHARAHMPQLMDEIMAQQGKSATAAVTTAATPALKSCLKAPKPSSPITKRVDVSAVPAKVCKQTLCMFKHTSDTPQAPRVAPVTVLTANGVVVPAHVLATPAPVKSCFASTRPVCPQFLRSARLPSSHATPGPGRPRGAQQGQRL